LTARDRRSPAARVGDLIGLPDDRESRVAVFAMMGLYFLVVLAVGILRPVRNALALDGLAEGDFYQVYLVSSLVILFVPLVNRLSNRFPWQRLIPAVALFFAVNLVVFRGVYQEGSTAFGLAFYGWYDLFAAALVAQLFMVTQLFFHARLAKNAYPVVIAGGSLGATLGGASPPSSPRLRWAMRARTTSHSGIRSKGRSPRVRSTPPSMHGNTACSARSTSRRGI
jgi:hypothetical protein